ncbi:hypothetical protein ACI6QG_18470, partial [Roseococcus sp. DSY-14]
AAPARSAAARPVAAPARQARALPAVVRGGRAQASLSTRQGRLAAVSSQRSRAMAAIPYSRQQAAPAGLRQTAMAACTTRNGRRSCGPVAAQARTVSFRWGGDLGPPTMAQSTCPDGTIATTAIGHSNVTRCVPL